MNINIENQTNNIDKQIKELESENNILIKKSIINILQKILEKNKFNKVLLNADMIYIIDNIIHMNKHDKKNIVISEDKTILELVNNLKYKLYLNKIENNAFNLKNENIEKELINKQKIIVILKNIKKFMDENSFDIKIKNKEIYDIKKIEEIIEQITLYINSKVIDNNEKNEYINDLLLNIQNINQTLYIIKNEKNAIECDFNQKEDIQQDLFNILDIKKTIQETHSLIKNNKKIKCLYVEKKKKLKIKDKLITDKIFNIINN